MPDTAGNTLSVTYTEFTPAFALPTEAELVAHGYGAAPFGEKDWIFLTMWLGLTTGAMRRHDSGYDLRRYQYALGRAINDRRRKARDFNLHDALLTQVAHATIPIADVEIEAYYTSEASDTAFAGRSTLVLDAALYDDRTFTPVQPGWVFVDNAGSRFEILEVFKGYAQGAMRGPVSYGRLVLFTVNGDPGEITAGASCVLEPPSWLAWLAEQYGVDLIDGLVEGNQRDTVFRAAWVLARKGSKPGIEGFCRQRGFDATAAGLVSLSDEWAASIAAVDPAYVVQGEVPWDGWCVGLGDGTSNAMDSDSDFTTFYNGTPDTTTGRVYAAGRQLGLGLGLSIEVKAPATNGADGDVYVRYTIRSADGVSRTFRLRDRRVSNLYGYLYPVNKRYTEAMGAVVGGVIRYETCQIVVFGLDQSVLTAETHRPFAARSRVTVDFVSLRQFGLMTDVEPRIARFDEIKADAMPLDTYLWEDPTAYEFAVTPGTITLSADPEYDSESEHTIRVTYTWSGGFSPIPATAANHVPIGRWALTDGTTDWWVERVSPVDANEDDIVVKGTSPPTALITKLVLHPRITSIDGYAVSRCIRLSATAIAGCYTDPSPSSSVEAESVAAAAGIEQISACAVLAVKELP